MRNLRRWIYVLILVMLIWLVAGCTEAGPQQMDAVTVAVNCDPGAELIGFYTAQGLGVYDEYTLVPEITINPDPMLNIQSVLDGEVDFGIASSLEIAAAQAQGADIQAVATIYRYNPAVLVTLGDKLVKRARDLRGKRIAVDTLDLVSMDDRQFAVLVERIGLSLEEMTFVAGSLGVRDNLLINDEVDVVTGFTATRDVLRFQQAGYDTRAHFLAEYGILVYPHVLFTTGERIEQEPEFVQRFVEATLRGYTYALEDPEGAVDVMVELAPGLNRDFELLVMEAQMSFIDPVDAPVGWMNLSVWERTIELLPVEDAETLHVFSLYTNAFVEQTWLVAENE